MSTITATIPGLGEYQCSGWDLTVAVGSYSHHNLANVRAITHRKLTTNDEAPPWMGLPMSMGQVQEPWCNLAIGDCLVILASMDAAERATMAAAAQRGTVDQEPDTLADDLAASLYAISDDPDGDMDRAEINAQQAHIDDEQTQEDADCLRRAAVLLDADAKTLDEHETTDAEYGRLRRAAQVCRIASNLR